MGVSPRGRGGLLLLPVFLHGHLKDSSVSIVLFMSETIFIDISGCGLGLGRGRTGDCFLPSAMSLGDTGEAPCPQFLRVFSVTWFWGRSNKGHGCKTCVGGLQSVCEGAGGRGEVEGAAGGRCEERWSRVWRPSGTAAICPPCTRLTGLRRCPRPCF